MQANNENKIPQEYFRSASPVYLMSYGFLLAQLFWGAFGSTNGA